jgi:hypothetical protein
MRAGETLTQVWAALSRATALAELGVLVACVLLAWIAVRVLRRQTPGSVWFGSRAIDGVLFPLLALALVAAARAALAQTMPIGLLRLAVPILASLPQLAGGTRLRTHAVVAGVVGHGAVGH